MRLDDAVDEDDLESRFKKPLTQKEIKLLDAIARLDYGGAYSSYAAKKLGISLITAGVHTASLRDKLSVSKTAAAVYIALNRGYISYGSIIEGIEPQLAQVEAGVRAFTPREIGFFRAFSKLLLSGSCSSKDIGEILGISVYTSYVHYTHIKEKLGLFKNQTINQAQLATVAYHFSGHYYFSQRERLAQLDSRLDRFKPLVQI